MCCEECPKYEKCVEDNHLENNCCPRCLEYYDCVGADERERGFDGTSYENEHE